MAAVAIPLNALFLIALLIVGVCVWGYFYAKRFGGESGANGMWLILLGGSAASMLMREIGIERYPQHEAIVRELENAVFGVTVLLTLAWIVGGIFGSRKEFKAAQPESKTAPSQ